MRLISLSFLSILYLLTGCATTDNPETQNPPTPIGVAKFQDDPRLGERITSACFPRQIRRFREPTEDTVVVVRSPNKQYLLEVQPVCLGLKRAQTVALISRQQTCLTRGDQIFVSEFVGTLSDGDFTTGRCQVRAIYEWDSNAKADTAPDTDAETATSSDN